MVKVWLSFAITPVQRFIEAARTVRDLKTGSEILCWLTSTAICAGKNSGGQLLFPWINDAEIEDGISYVKHIPNQFIMTFDDENTAREAESICRNAVEDAWQGLATGVHELLEHGWRGLNWNPENEWNRQINSFWDIHTVVMPPADDISYNQLFGGAPESDPWRRQWKMVSAALAIGKQVRRYPGNQGIGRAKCSMMGDFQQMGPGGTLGEQNDFWTNRNVAAFTREGIRIGTRDRLCAVALAKRFSPVKTNALRELKSNVPDTATLAIEAWCAEIEEKMGPLFNAWSDAAAAYCKIMGEGADRPGRYLLDEDLKEPTETESPDDKDVAECKAKFQAMKNARGRLFDEVRDKGIDLPPRYFAALALDGDKMGKWLSGDPDYIGNTPLNKEYYHELSSKLRVFGKSTAPEIIERHHGYLVYAGGDDLLAFLPVREVLACSLELQDAYPQLAGLVPTTTASVGISICHYSHDLRSVLRQARAALEEAKDNGRNRIGWHLLKRAGGDIQGILERPLAATLQKVAAIFERGISDRWVYRLAKTSDSLHTTAELMTGRALYRHALKRVEGSEEDKQILKSNADELWQAVCTNLQDRNDFWNSNVGNEDRRKVTGEVDFTGECLQTFINALLLAIFIIRGRD